MSVKARLLALAAALLISVIAVGVWWLAQEHEAPTEVVVAPVPTALVIPTVEHDEVHKVVIVTGGALTPPTPQTWSDRCAILVLRESYGTNPEDKAKCGEYERTKK